MKWAGSFEVFGALLFLLVSMMFFVTLKACASIDSPDDYRYRLTIYADGRTFSSVTQVKYESDFALEGLRKQHVDHTNHNPVAIAAPGRATVYALPIYDVPPEAVATIVATKRESASGKGKYEPTIALQTERDLPRQVLRGDISDGPYHRDDVIRTWPMFVTFTDPADPTSWHEVSANELGVTRVTVQLTQDSDSRPTFRAERPVWRVIFAETPSNLPRHGVP